jgi:hypothetical protein
MKKLFTLAALAAMTFAVSAPAEAQWNSNNPKATPKPRFTCVAKNSNDRAFTARGYSTAQAAQNAAMKMCLDRSGRGRSTCQITDCNAIG